jgi:hypothetical protein
VLLPTSAIPIERGACWRGSVCGLLLLWTTCTFRGLESNLGFRRLGRVSAKQAIFEGGAIEAADDRIHFFVIRGVDEREALGFLRFGVSDDLNSVGDQTFGCQPRPDIVCGHPYGEVSEKYGKAHSYFCFLLRGDCLRDRVGGAAHESISIVTHRFGCEKRQTFPVAEALRKCVYELVLVQWQKPAGDTVRCESG